MMSFVHRSKFVGLALVSLLWVSNALGQDAVTSAGNHHKLLFENDHIRVLEFMAKAGDKVPRHSHPDHLVYRLTEGKTKVTNPDGKVNEYDHKAGGAFWVPAGAHDIENVGKTEVRSVVFEFKKATKPLPTDNPIGTAEDAVKVSPTTTKVLFENERARLLETRMKAGEKLPMHAHPSSVVYALTPVKAKMTSPDGKTSEQELQVGKVLWSDPHKHAVEHTGTGEIHLIHLELKPT